MKGVQSQRREMKRWGEKSWGVIYKMGFLCWLTARRRRWSKRRNWLPPKRDTLATDATTRGVSFLQSNDDDNETSRHLRRLRRLFARQSYSSERNELSCPPCPATARQSCRTYNVTMVVKAFDYLTITSNNLDHLTFDTFIWQIATNFDDFAGGKYLHGDLASSLF